MSKYLHDYLVAVEHPEVSGFEHLNMLLIRDQLARIEQQLSAEEKLQLLAADQRLLNQARAFYAALSRVTDLAGERQQRRPPPQHWWWYLDVVVQPPLWQRIATAVPAAA
jgi:hypothetical protein